MQVIFLSTLCLAIASVFCDPSSSLSPNIIEESSTPHVSYSDSSSSGLPSSTPSYQTSTDDVAPSSIPPPESCDNPPCNVIVIQMNDPANRTDLQKSVDEVYSDRVVRWLVVAKTTHVDRTEEILDDFMSGKKKKVSSENRFEQLQVMRDSRHAFMGNEFDLVSVFK